MEALMSSNCKVSLPRIRSSSSYSNNNNRNNSIKLSTYKGSHGNSSILRKSLTWSTNFYTRKNYMGPMLASQGNDVQSSADNNNAGPPPGKSWINWVVGLILSVVMPFVTGKWKTVLAIKDEVCRVLNTVETVAETVENVADEVAQVADEVANSLPEGGTMQNIVCNISHVAEHTAQNAHFVDQFIDKVEDVENEIVSSFANGVHKTPAQEVKVHELDEVAKDDNIQSDKQPEQKHEIAMEEVTQTKIIDQPK